MQPASDDEHAGATAASSGDDQGDERGSSIDASDEEPTPPGETGDGESGPSTQGVESSRPDGRSAADDGAGPAEGGNEEWEFSIDEVGDEETGDERSGNVTGSIRNRGPLEPGDIDLENAVFFLVGSLGTVLFVVLAVAGF